MKVIVLAELKLLKEPFLPSAPGLNSNSYLRVGEQEGVAYSQLPLK